MHTAGLLTILGLVLLFTPVIMAFKAGAQDDGDIYQWFAKLPLNTIMIIQGFMMFGVMLLAAGAMRGMEWTILSR